jgi:hypothetical protein
MFDLARLNKLVGCRVLGSVEPNAGNAPPRSDWPLAARIHQILRAALPGAAFLILFEVATVAIVRAPPRGHMAPQGPMPLRTLLRSCCMFSAVFNGGNGGFGETQLI